MEEQRKPSTWRFLTWTLLGFGLLLLAIQVWVAAVITPEIMRQAQSSAASVQSAEIDREKTREELVGRRFENASRNQFLPLVSATLGSLAALLVTLSGAILALEGYLAAREKERQDRLKERQDRLEAALGAAVTRLVSKERRERVVGAALLQAFFAPDRAEFHPAAFAALIAAARAADEPPEVLQATRLTIERAARSITPAVLGQLSWQRCRLAQINLEACQLGGLDLRDVDFENARLAGATLSGADLTSAQLKGAQLQGALLRGANLTYADLAGASLAGADLTGARVDGMKVLDLDLAGAVLEGIEGDWEGVPWDATRNWRQARFSPAMRRALDAKYGPEKAGPRVLMLMWEIPPLVAGGTWTACYHLVRKLRRAGADVTVVVPWDRAAILAGAAGGGNPPSLMLTAPFGAEVEIVSLGMQPPAFAERQVPTGPPPWSSYGDSGSFWSEDGGSPSFWSAYGGGAYASYGGPVPSAYSGGAAPSLAGSVLFRLIGEFRQRLDAYVAAHSLDVIHAHDWVTFEAARDAARRAGIPWIAHVHSTEAERRPDGGDPLIEQIERAGVASARAVIVPSEVTLLRLRAAYGGEPARQHVIPNMLSEITASTADMGRFESRRVIFLGRLSRQKGVDRFCSVADRLAGALGARFEVFGAGEEAQELGGHAVTLRGPIGWDRRGKAFRGASVVLVLSRAEPFGMVILEAMEHRVPVIYPRDAGAAEFLASGVPVDAANTDAVIEAVRELLGDLGTWERTVREQVAEVTGFVQRNDEARLMAIWREVAGAHPRHSSPAPG